MKNNTSSSGIGCLGLLQVVLIALKITNLTDISWWWVFSPSILWFLVFVGTIVLALVNAVFGE